MISLISLSDLNSLITNGVQENLHLDYKDNRALAKDKRDELVKDVSAFANADGGVLIFGIREKDHFPDSLDDGVSNHDISREWIEQILQSNITPPIVGIQIVQIPLDTNKSYFVIQIPKSYRGPHQASDKKYYKRYNFKSSPMDHYEIQDITSRRQRIPQSIMLDLEVDDYFKLVCTNIGNEVVKDLSFSFLPGFIWPRGEMPTALKEGIRYFPAGKKMKFIYSGIHQIINSESNLSKILEVEVKYRLVEIEQLISERFILDTHDYIGTALDRNDSRIIVNAIESGFKAVVNAIKSRK